MARFMLNAGSMETSRTRALSAELARMLGLVGLVGASAFGCNALVGLDSLEYQSGDGPGMGGSENPGTGGRSSDGFETGGNGSGGVGSGPSGCTTCGPPSVQAKWPKSSIFFSIAPGGQSSEFFRFDQETRVVETYKLGTAEPVGRVQLSQVFTLWAALPAGSAHELLGYEPEEGQAINLVLGGGSDGASTYGYGTQGRTLLRSMVVQGAPSFLGYTGTTGSLRSVPGSSGPTDRQALEKLIGPGWSSLEPIQIDGEMQLLAHSSERQELQLFRLTKDAIEPGPTAESPIPATLVRTFHEDQLHRVLFYDSAIGSVDIADISLTAEGQLDFEMVRGSSDGLGGAGFEEADPWREGLTDIIICGLASDPYALSWNHGTGILSLHALSDLSTNGSPIITK
jgi:hypothetical protein